MYFNEKNNFKYIEDLLNKETHHNTGSVDWFSVNAKEENKRYYFIVYESRMSVFKVAYLEDKDQIAMSKVSSLSFKDYFNGSYIEDEYKFFCHLPCKEFPDILNGYFNDLNLTYLVKKNNCYLVGVEKDFLVVFDKENKKLKQWEKFGHKALIENYFKNKREETIDILNKVRIINEGIRSYVKGQDSIIKDLNYFIYKSIQYIKKKGEKPNLLIAGPSGTGKTYSIGKMVNFLSKNIDKKIGMVEFDASRLTPSGYRGVNLDHLIRKINNELEDKDYCIIFIDEIDKLLLKGDESSSFYSSVISELLKLIEGNISYSDSTKKEENVVELKLNKCIFVMAGAFGGEFFENKEEMMKRFSNKVGIQEFLGRIDFLSSTNHLNKKSLLDIIDSENGLYSQKIKSLKGMGFEINFSAKVKDDLAEAGLNSSFGVRKINSLIKELEKRIFDQALSNGCFNFNDDFYFKNENIFL